MSKTRKPRQRRKKTRRRQRRGGKVIGMGGSGYVHYGKEGSEHVVCADGSQWKEGEVAKMGNNLHDELERVKAIRAHYPKISEFAILPTRVCLADPKHYDEFLKSQPDSDTKTMLTEYPEGPPEILFSPYGGTTLESVLKAPAGTYDIAKVVSALTILRNHVKDMNAHRVYHVDIGYANIVYKNDKAYLIDFGLSSVVDEDEDTSNLTDIADMDNILRFVSTKRGARRKHFQRSRS